MDENLPAKWEDVNKCSMQIACCTKVVKVKASRKGTCKKSFQIADTITVIRTERNEDFKDSFNLQACDYRPGWICTYVYFSDK